METLSIALQPYKEVVGAITAVVTTGQMFSGSFMCYDIYKQGSTKGTPFMAFLGGLIMGLLNLKFGFMLRDDTMIRVNFFGVALSIVYIMIFYNYAEQKGQVWSQMGAAGALVAALFAYSEYEDPTLIERRFGTIITVFMFYLVASPLLGLKTIIKNKSTEGLPFPLILSGSVVTFMWLLYGIILNNAIIVLQNVVVFLLCAFQLSLFVIYPKKKQTAGKEKVFFSKSAEEGIKPYMLIDALVAALFAYSEYEDPTLIERRFGTIITVFMFYLVASPLLGLKTIIKNKSTEGLPFPLILSGSVVTFMWLLYGIILNNAIIVLQNVVVFLLCAFQLSLFVIYPKKKQTAGKEKVRAKKTN